MADVAFAALSTDQEDVEKIERCIAKGNGPNPEWLTSLTRVWMTPSTWLKKGKALNAGLSAVERGHANTEPRLQAVERALERGEFSSPDLTAEILIAVGQHIANQFEASKEKVAKDQKEERDQQARMAGRSPPMKRDKEEAHPIAEALILGKENMNLTVEFRTAVGVDKEHASMVGLKVRQKLDKQEEETLQLMLAQPVVGPMNKAAIVGPGAAAQEKLYDFAVKLAGFFLEAKHNMVLDHTKMLADLTGSAGNAGLAKYAKKEETTPARPAVRLSAPAVSPTATVAATPAVARVPPPIRPGVCLTCGLKHATEECQINIETLSCMTCKQLGHATGICPLRRY